MVSFNGGLCWLNQTGEEFDSDLGDGLLVGHSDTVVKGLAASDAILLAVHNEAT